MNWVEERIKKEKNFKASIEKIWREVYQECSQSVGAWHAGMQGSGSKRWPRVVGPEGADHFEVVMNRAGDAPIPEVIDRLTVSLDRSLRKIITERENQIGGNPLEIKPAPNSGDATLFSGDEAISPAAASKVLLEGLLFPGAEQA